MRNFACFKKVYLFAPKNGGKGVDVIKSLFYCIGISYEVKNFDAQLAARNESLCDLLARGEFASRTLCSCRNF